MGGLQLTLILEDSILSDGSFSQEGEFGTQSLKRDCVPSSSSLLKLPPLRILSSGLSVK